MQEMSLYAGEEAALAAPGEVYRHYKGGVYRLVARDVKHSETEEMGVVYEHLWPHPHKFWYRPSDSFFGILPNGEPRFRLIKSA